MCSKVSKSPMAGSIRCSNAQRSDVFCTSSFIRLFIRHYREILQKKNIFPRYAWLGKSWMKTFISSVDSQKVFLRSALCPQITMVPTQLSICLLFVPRNPHNRVFKISSSSTHTIGLNGRNEHCPHSLGDKQIRAQQ